MENQITINDYKYGFEPGETILEVAGRNDLFIPTLCNLKGVTPTGACRICVVKVKGIPGLVAACSTPAAPDWEVYTDTPDIIEARRMVLEFLLISGNHNCSVRGFFPNEWTDFQNEVIRYDRADDICTAFGQCELQALAYRYLVAGKKLDHLPPIYPLDADDPLIGSDYSRCILCGRCVHACNDIQVNKALAHGYRGILAKIIFKGDMTVSHSNCVFCGECLQVCPTGALFEKKNRFKSRMWKVKHVRTTCHYCGVGCQLDLHMMESQIVKIIGCEEAEPNHDGRLCFKGRFAYDFIYSGDRLTSPLIRKEGKLCEANWDEALDLIVKKIGEITAQKGSASHGCLVSAKYTNEDIFQAKKFFNGVLSSENVYHFEPSAFSGINYDELREASTIIIIGLDITRENPVAGSYIKQAVLAGTRLITVGLAEKEISAFASLILDDLTGLEKEIDNNTAIVYNPGYNISSLMKLDNVKLFSLCRENNTMGLYFQDIERGRDFKTADMKFIYSMGDFLTNREDIEFLVVQDVFPNESTEMADVVLPSAVWIEYDGTDISSDFCVNRTRAALSPPGDARPGWWIFKELARRMGQDWESGSSKEIWENEIIVNYPCFKNIKYDSLEGNGIKIAPKRNLPDEPVYDLPDGIKRPNYHRILCEHSLDLENILYRVD